MSTTIMQRGYRFVYRETVPGLPPIVESWGIERVAAFIYLVDFYRRKSQKYVKGYTLVSAVGNIQYELGECDKPTYRDIDRLVNLLVPYDQEGIDCVWMVDFKQALDLAENMLIKKVAEKEAPIRVFDQDLLPPRWYSRPTEEVYEKEEKDKADLIRKVAGEGAKIIHIWFPDYGVLPCSVLKETASCVWVTAYFKNKPIFENRRMMRSTMRVFD